MLVGLVFACPATCGNPPACPLHDIRHRPVSERVAWVKKLTDAERLQILDWHEQCLARQEGGVPPGVVPAGSSLCSLASQIGPSISSIGLA